LIGVNALEDPAVVGCGGVVVLDVGGQARSCGRLPGQLTKRIVGKRIGVEEARRPPRPIVSAGRPRESTERGELLGRALGGVLTEQEWIGICVVHARVAPSLSTDECLDKFLVATPGRALVSRP